MKRFLSAAIVIGAVVVTAPVAAQNPWLGTWNLNVARSKLLDSNGTDLLKSVIVIQALGDSIKIIDDDTPVRGKAKHFEWIGQFDGNDYPAPGDATGTTWSYTPLDAHTLLLTVRTDGKVRATRQITLSPDGETRTMFGTRADGTRVAAVYERNR